MKMRSSRVRIPSLLPLIHTHHQIEPETPPEELIYAIVFMIMTSLIQLPYEYINGDPVPKIIFNGQPSTFHAFLLFLLASFGCAVSTMSLRDDHPNAAAFCRRLAIVLMAVAVAIFLWAAVPATFWWVVSLCC